jgi:ring-1,2-phenylacetyl-CoA epoxidase subunit PaaD
VSVANAVDATTLERARAVAEGVADPELTFLSLADLGVVRDVRRGADGAVEVLLSPTWLGCPATDVIADDVARALAGAGIRPARIVRALAPPWTTDCLSEAARDKLRAHGIAPPADVPGDGGTPVSAICPRCGLGGARRVSEYSSTPCKAHYVCRGCLEPFEQFKCLR